MRYAQTLKVGEKAYAWNGTIRYPVEVLEITGRYIRVKRFGKFGKKTGKGIDYGYMELANAAGEVEVDG